MKLKLDDLADQTSVDPGAIGSHEGDKGPTCSINGAPPNLCSTCAYPYPKQRSISSQDRPCIGVPDRDQAFLDLSLIGDYGICAGSCQGRLRRNGFRKQNCLKRAARAGSRRDQYLQKLQTGTHGGPNRKRVNNPR